MANSATARQDDIYDNSGRIDDLVAKNTTTKEEIIGILKEIKNSGGEIKDIPQNSRLGESIKDVSGNLRYISIDAAIIDLQKKVIQKDEAKIIEKQKAEEGEIVKKTSDNKQTRTEKKEEKRREEKRKREENEKKKKTENTTEVEEQIREVSKKSAEDLKGGEKLEKVIRDDLEATIKGKTIKTDNEEVADLADKIANAMGREKDTEIMVEVKKIQVSRKEYENKNIEKVRDYQKVNFEKDFVEETVKLNPNLDENQIGLVKKKANIIADVYFGDNGIEDQKDSALEFNKDTPRGARDTAWVDMQGITSLLKKSPKELEKIKGEYQDLTEKLKGINLPNIDKFKSFEGIMNSLQDPITSKLFGRAQKYVQLFDKFDSLTGGWLKRTTVELGGKFASRIGNQAVSAFVQNSMSVLAEKGFEQGFSTILKGIFSGGVKATGTAAVKAGAGAAAKAGGKAVASFGAKVLAKLGIEVGVATVPVAGWIVAVALAALDVIKFIKNIGDKIGEKLNLNLGIKEFFQDNFGKVFGGALNFLVGGAMAVVAIPAMIGGIALLSIGPIIGITMGSIFGYQVLQNNLVSSVVPPIEKYQQDKTGDVSIPDTPSGDIVLPTITVGSVSHQDLINMATALKGKVMYVHAGVWSHLPPNAINPRWKDGSAGLDCIGFVRWVYYQITGGKFTGYIMDIWNSGYGWTQVDEADIQTGDVGVNVRPCLDDEGKQTTCRHVGLYLKTENGNKIFIHTNHTGTPVKLCSDTARIEGNNTCSWMRYYRPGKSLIDFVDD